jgi:hypothetical protein
VTPAPGTYVFCVFHAAGTPSLGRGAGSLPGAGRARCLRLRGPLWLAVADAPAAAFSEAAIQRCLQDVDSVARYALAHEAVVERVFRRWPVVPLKLFTVFHSDARAIEALAARREELSRLVKRLRGRQEWSARVLPGRPRPTELPRVGASGRTYLEAKRVQHENVKGWKVRLSGEADHVFAELGLIAAEARRRTPDGALRPGAAVGVDAAFLVPAAKVAAWKARARQLAAHLDARGLALEISGPWPPYTFATPDSAD